MQLLALGLNHETAPLEVREKVAFGPDIMEDALADLARVAAMTDEVPEGEENESDLNEILEFVRISTLLIFAASDSAKAH